MIKKIIITILCLTFVSLSTFACADTNVTGVKNVQSQEVYATKNGKKYHKAECPFIQGKNAERISKKEALEKKLTPCPKCFKEDLPDQPKKINK